ncbi:MAG: nickel pincer cofactor biosynthesis protein LarB [Syntrophomonadaceae bacterium]|jgi:NCAIR mutase (PurE)-related protein
MTKDWLYQLLESLARGETDTDTAYAQLKSLPYEDIGFAKIDHHRALRDNFPEVIFCQGKTTSQIKAIFERLATSNANIIGTRASYETFLELLKSVPDLQYDQMSRVLYLRRAKAPVAGRVAVVSAGTADLPVAEEAAISLEVMGAVVDRVYDVGVAGLHRLLDKLAVIKEAQVVIAVAGMEGALASVLGGLLSCPVIAVPTSIGYGASFNGLAALLAMLNSCATGVGVVNIDNGFGAASLAFSILKTKDG